MQTHKLLLIVILLSSNAVAGDDWQTLFNGKDLTGWRANVYPDSFSVVDGTIRARATRESSHLFYVGEMKEGFVRFKNFELEATARCDGIANSGIYFHTDMSVSNAKNHLAKGYEVQLNNQARDPKKTGSLYAVVDVAKSPVDETKWFKIRIKVQGKHVLIYVNDKQMVDYTEPEGAQRPPERKGRLIDPNGGAIALQGHDPSSTYYFKDIRLRKLP